MSAASSQYQYPQACIVMFAKVPRAGQVKTRLIPALGEQGALNVHEQLVRRQLAVITNTRLCCSQLWLDELDNSALFDSFTGPIKQQSGENLGEKMWQAATEVLQEFKIVLIIGSDCPDLNEFYLAQALRALAKPDIDVVLGPALDGGYVLIGLKEAEWNIFRDVYWGSEKVLQQTLDRLKANKLTYQSLLALRDIDTQEDLAYLL